MQIVSIFIRPLLGMSSQCGLSIGGDIYTFNSNTNATGLKELHQAHVDTYDHTT